MATLTPPPPRVAVLNLPNQLTFLRFGLAVCLFALIDFECWGWCLVVFALAAVTDWLDGYLARRYQLTSDLGRNLDPLVDKLLICGTYIFLLPLGDRNGWLRPWMVTVVVGRELVITALRSYLENQGARFGADFLGKLKTTLQFAALFAVFAACQWPDLAPVPAWWLRAALIYAMLLATLLSGLQYLWRAAALLRSTELGR